MLRWNNIDFDQGILQIRRAWKDVNEEGPPKWNKIRDVPLPDRTAHCLKKCRKTSSHVLPDSLVFCYWDGNRLGNTWWAKHWNKVMNKSNIPARVRNLKPHSLRHSLNTILRDKGVPDAKIRATMGWTNEKTQDNYTHFGSAHLRGQADIIDGIFH